MSDRPLPPPATQADEYSYATVLELRRLNASISSLARAILHMTLPAESDATDEVALREPKAEPQRKPRTRDAKRAEKGKG